MFKWLAPLRQIQEVPGFNLGTDVAILAVIFCSFPHAFQANQMLGYTLMGHNYFLLHPAQFITTQSTQLRRCY